MFGVYKERKKTGILANHDSPFARLHSVPVGAVKMQDGFWKKRMLKNQKVAIPAVLRRLEEHGVVDNFLRLAGKKDVPRRGPLFTDSDLYKWVEAAAFALQSEIDRELQSALNRVIEAIAGAQGEDGYLNTWHVDERKGERFQNLEKGSHELYCAGHLFQAALALYRGIGDTRLLDVSTRFADYLCNVFGPDKRKGFDGHPEVEMALVELYRETGKERYLRLSEFFLEQQGYQDMEEFQGHAVRAAYFASGLADYYAETGNPIALSVLEKLWNSMTKTRMYITGGLGGRHVGESVGRPYELPNERAYAETCAAIANSMWNYRMLSLKGEARFADIMELALYNGFLAGVSLEGDSFFYVNPLRYNGKGEGDPWYEWARVGPYRRQEWFDCTCCPTNVIRQIASIPGYLFSTSKEGVWVHLYDNAMLDWCLEDGTPFTLMQSTKYPWDGGIELEVSPEHPAEFSVFLRVPGWCKKYTIAINGDIVGGKLANAGESRSHASAIESNGYLELRRCWNKGDRISLQMTMEPVFMVSHPRVVENRNSVALLRGPIVYCFEGVDNPEVPVLDARVTIDHPDDVKVQYEEDLLGGVATIKCPGEVPLELPAALYMPIEDVVESDTKKVALKAIPYFAWANREVAPMTVWIERS